MHARGKNPFFNSYSQIQIGFPISSTVISLPLRELMWQHEAILRCNPCVSYLTLRNRLLKLWLLVWARIHSKVMTNQCSFWSLTQSHVSVTPKSPGILPTKKNKALKEALLESRKLDTTIKKEKYNKHYCEYVLFGSWQNISGHSSFLLGLPGSGKSTLMRALKIIEEGYSNEVCWMFESQFMYSFHIQGTNRLHPIG